MKKIISDYMQNYRGGEKSEREFFSSRNSLKEAISFAALARSDKGKFSHQYRISNNSLESSQIILLGSIDAIIKAKNFHDLLEVIDHLIRPIHGIGDLTIYDTALRIGIKLGLKPEYIYLHAGTREGAKNLGLQVNVPYLLKSQLPKEFSGLDADQIESILCIYKNEFNNGKFTGARNSRC